MYGTCEPAAVPGQAENRFPLKVAPNFQLARSLALALPRLRRVLLRCRKAPVGGAGNSRRRIFMSKPAHKLRVGVLQVTIWRNTSEKGNWYSVIPSRSYKNGDETWKETDSLGFDDLLTMAKLFDQAHSFIDSLRTPIRSHSLC
jgi:hypothetical protein